MRKKMLALVLAIASLMALVPVSTGMALSGWQYSDDNTMGILVHAPAEGATLYNGQGFSFEFELKNTKTVNGKKSSVYYDAALYGADSSGKLDLDNRVKDLKLQNQSNVGSKYVYTLNLSDVSAGDYYLVMIVWNETVKNANGGNDAKDNSIAYDYRKVKVASSNAGWEKFAKGWSYKKEGQWVKGKWEMIDGKWYLFDGSGYMLTYWQQYGGKWYYLGHDGYMRTGWSSINGKWYCFHNSGYMFAKVWLKDNNKWYMLGEDGAMLTGWQQDRNQWYYMTPGSGEMYTGWLQLGSTWYYLDAGNGKMATGTVTIGDEKHNFNSSGVWTGKA